MTSPSPPVNSAQAGESRVRMTSINLRALNLDIRPQPAASREELIDSLAEILGDLDTPHACVILGRMRKLANSIRDTDVARSPAVLSPRETEVLVLLAHGYTRRDISQSLSISSHTAARHIANIYNKLGISSVAEATTFALKHKLIALDNQ